MKERERRLNQMLRVTQNRLRRFGLSRRRHPAGLWFAPADKIKASDWHNEIQRLLGLLGRQDNVDTMGTARKDAS